MGTELMNKIVSLNKAEQERIKKLEEERKRKEEEERLRKQEDEQRKKKWKRRTSCSKNRMRRGSRGKSKNAETENWRRGCKWKPRKKKFRSRLLRPKKQTSFATKRDCAMTCRNGPMRNSGTLSTLRLTLK